MQPLQRLLRTPLMHTTIAGGVTFGRSPPSTALRVSLNQEQDSVYCAAGVTHLEESTHSLQRCLLLRFGGYDDQADILTC
jgi:hypothetical protein